MASSEVGIGGRNEPAPLDAGRGYRLHPQVALRPERFGALAYHYGTRRLSLLKSAPVLALVRDLDRHATAAEALAALDVPDGHRPAYRRALARLVETGFVCAR